MFKFKTIATYVHDFRRFDLRYLGEITRDDAFTLLAEAREAELIETERPEANDLLLNKGFVVVRRVGSCAIILANHDGNYRLHTADWLGLSSYLVEQQGRTLPQGFMREYANALSSLSQGRG